MDIKPTVEGPFREVSEWTLLRNEEDFIRWFEFSDGSNETLEEYRVRHRPELFPCFGGGYLMDAYCFPQYLYPNDVARMVRLLLETKG